MTKYEWKLASFAKGIDPNEAVEELERIETVYGSLTAENLLEASKAEDAVLHNLFVWDNDKAAHQYRLQQARTIINNIEVVIVSDGQTRQISVYEIIKKDDKKIYKSIEDFTKTDIEQVKAQTVREINTLKNKLSFYNQFNQATKKLNEAIEAMN